MITFISQCTQRYCLTKPILSYAEHANCASHLRWEHVGNQIYILQEMQPAFTAAEKSNDRVSDAFLGWLSLWRIMPIVGQQSIVLTSDNWMINVSKTFDPICFLLYTEKVPPYSVSGPCYTKGHFHEIYCWSIFLNKSTTKQIWSFHRTVNGQGLSYNKCVSTWAPAVIFQDSL